MPTNLPAEAQKALAKYQVARTVPEKIKALEEALSLIPDHKGTEKLRGQLKRRIAELKREAERKAAAKASRRDFFTVSKEGDSQAVIIGSTNSGKSSLLRALTNAKPIVAPYPFSTDKPTPGMMCYEDVEIQLVELPAILTEELEETQYTSRSLGFVKNSDGLIILLDGLNNPVKQLEKILELLDEAGISIKPKKGEIIIEKKDSGGIRTVTFGKLHGTYREVEELLRNVGIRNAVVKIYGDASIEDLEEAIIRETIYKKALIVLNKVDAAGSTELDRLKSMLGNLQIPFTFISAERKENLEDLKEKIFESLRLIRVYTRKDGVVSRKPIVMSENASVRELAERIHKDLARRMKYARIWGRSVRIQGQQVGSDHVLQDGDIVEIYSG
jgi:ribosome-interacting GTPase 1